MVKSVCWLCATHESWPFRSLKSMKDFLNTWITSKFQCSLVASASRRTSRPSRPTAHTLSLAHLAEYWLWHARKHLISSISSTSSLMNATRCWNSLVRRLHISFFVCVQKGCRMIPQKMCALEIFGLMSKSQFKCLMDFEVTFLGDFVSWSLEHF